MYRKKGRAHGGRVQRLYSWKPILETKIQEMKIAKDIGALKHGESLSEEHRFCRALAFLFDRSIRNLLWLENS